MTKYRYFDNIMCCVAFLVRIRHAEIDVDKKYMIYRDFRRFFCVCEFWRLLQFTGIFIMFNFPFVYLQFDRYFLLIKILNYVLHSAKGLRSKGVWEELKAVQYFN